MKRKGFTLVELLAVIAILAILVIMALPAVLRMFNSARKDSFTNEVNTVIRTARQQYLLSGGSDTTWSNAEGSTSTLDLTGNSRLKYYVQMNNEGKITKLQVTNGDFQYNVTNNAGIDVVESNSVQVVSELDDNEILVISSENVSEPDNYVYSTADTSYTVGSSAPSNVVTYTNYQDAINAFGHPFFMRYTIEDNIVTEAYVGFVWNSNVYYLKGYDVDAYNDNKAIMQSLFDSSKCHSYPNFYSCSDSGLLTDAYNTGRIRVGGNGMNCFVEPDSLGTYGRCAAGGEVDWTITKGTGGPK